MSTGGEGEIGLVNTVEWTDAGTVRLLDQTRLPLEEVYVECRGADEVAEAIRRMQVRGAPAIGVAGAMGVALGAQGIAADGFEAFARQLGQIGRRLLQTRPTAVNLAWGIQRMQACAERHRDRPIPAIKAALVAEARAIREEDIRVNRAMGAQGAALVPDPARILTHCNAGALATAGYGTALGVVRSAFVAGKKVSVWVSETRPFLQGARLTAWELAKDGIPTTLITDSMAGYFMAHGQVDLILVGADRIAANGDVANKIGTYTLAILAQAHGVPFYVAAPLSTLDLKLPDGAAIPIEERDPEEVTHVAGHPIAPSGVPAAHPAFDVTPARLVTAIITERGVARPPYEDSLAALAGA